MGEVESAFHRAEIIEDWIDVICVMPPGGRLQSITLAVRDDEWLDDWATGIHRRTEREPVLDMHLMPGKTVARFLTAEVAPNFHVYVWGPRRQMVPGDAAELAIPVVS